MATWTVRDDAGRIVAVVSTDADRVVLEILERRRGRLLRHGRRTRLIASIETAEDLRTMVGAAIGVARWAKIDTGATLGGDKP